jgi:NADH dehydrogenase [ubiquinone] 1 alpha subcomplex assembly factor 6
MSDQVFHLAEEVRRHDWDRFMCALFAPAVRRDDLYVLLAFNLEIAKTREVVSEPLIGEMRLQWWRDVIDKIYTSGPEPVAGHYVLEHLPGLVHKLGLSRHWFDALVDARQTDLDNEPFADLHALIDYADATSASLNMLMLEALCGGDALAEDQWDEVCEASRGIGIAWALTGLMRVIPHWAGQGRSPLPIGLLEECGLTTEQAYAPGEDFGAGTAVERLCRIAREKVAAARQRRRTASRRFRSVLLPAALIDSHILELEKTAFNPYLIKPVYGRFGQQIRLGIKAATGGY